MMQERGAEYERRGRWGEWGGEGSRTCSEADGCLEMTQGGRGREGSLGAMLHGLGHLAKRSSTLESSKEVAQ